MSVSRTAKYQQVVKWIESRVEAGELKEGDKLESENEISAIFQISRQTVRHALAILGKEGVLESIQGSGNFVRKTQRKENRSLSSRVVTIVSTYVDDYIFPRILQAMAKVLEQKDYAIQIMFTSNQLETERRILRRLLEEERTGPIIMEPVMSGLPSPNVEYYRRLQERGVPIIFFHSYYPELDIPYVCVDDVEAGRLATEYLIQQGHSKIAGIFRLDDGQGLRRYQGYLTALREADYPVRERRVTWIDTEEQQRLMSSRERILRRLKGCSACVCYNDEVAHLLTEICREEGIRIPEDLSITGVDNSEMANLNAVPLTSVAHPMEVLGEKVAENLLRRIEDPSFDAIYEFKPDLKVRASVKAYSSSKEHDKK